MTNVKQRELLNDLRGKGQALLVSDLKAAQQKLLELQFGVSLKKLKKTDEIRRTRKLIARIQTILAEQLTKLVLDQATQKGKKE